MSLFHSLFFNRDNLRAPQKWRHCIFVTFSGWYHFVFASRKQEVFQNTLTTFLEMSSYPCSADQHSDVDQSHLCLSRPGMSWGARRGLTLFSRRLLKGLQMKLLTQTRVHPRLLDVKPGYYRFNSDCLLALLLWTRCGGCWSLGRDVFGGVLALDLKTAATARLTQDTTTRRVHNQLRCKSRFCYPQDHIKARFRSLAHSNRGTHWKCGLSTWD